MLCILRVCDVDEKISRKFSQHTFFVRNCLKFFNLLSCWLLRQDNKMILINQILLILVASAALTSALPVLDSEGNELVEFHAVNVEGGLHGAKSFADHAESEIGVTNNSVIFRTIGII